MRDDLDPHLIAAQALVLMVGYLGMESVVAASAGKKPLWTCWSRGSPRAEVARENRSRIHA